MVEVAAALRWGADRLLEVSPTARLDAECLLMQVLQQNRAWLLTWPDKPLVDSHWQAFQALIERRFKGEPVAYLTGQQEFWSLPLQVTPATLIPRPETELLVEKVLRCAPEDSASRVLDLGTGSGAIALALASERPCWQVTACDKSLAALQVAQLNQGRLSVSVNWVATNWLRAFAANSFDILVANPPYLAEQDAHLQQGDLRFEPRSALAAGADGLVDIKSIAAQASHCLAVGGQLLFEHGCDQGAAVREMLQQQGFSEVASDTDLSGHERISYGRLDD